MGKSLNHDLRLMTNILKRPPDSYFKYSGMGFQILGTLILGGYLGYRLDLYLDSEKLYFTLTGLLVGVCFSIYLALKLFFQNKDQ